MRETYYYCTGAEQRLLERFPQLLNQGVSEVAFKWLRTLLHIKSLVKPLDTSTLLQWLQPYLAKGNIVVPMNEVGINRQWISRPNTPHDLWWILNPLALLNQWCLDHGFLGGPSIMHF